MGLFDKVKNILFVEEEVEIPVIDQVSEKKEEVKEENAPKKFDNTLPELEETKRVPVVDDEPKENINNFKNIKRDIDLDYDFDLEDEEEKESLKQEVVKDEKDSPFLSFDEEEFERLNASIQNSINKKEDHRKDSYPVERKEVVREKQKKEPKVEPPKRFRVSPVISPVYGILDKNYKKEDIVEKNEDNNKSNIETSFDIDSVRKKAYGTLEDDIENNISKDLPKFAGIDTLEKEDTSTIELKDLGIDDEEEVFVVDESKVEEIEDIEKIEEKEVVTEEVSNKEEKTEEIEIEEEKEDIESEIDDAIEEEEIEDTTIEEIEEEIPSYEEVKDEEEFDNNINDDILEKTNALKILDDIEKELDEVTEIKKKKKVKEIEDIKEESKEEKKEIVDDATDTDLFNLIDSMYDDEEDN